MEHLTRRNVVFIATLVCIYIHLSLTLNECTSNPCVNGSTCRDGPYGYYTCECPHGYHGTNCESPLADDKLDDLCYFSISDPVTIVTSPGFPMESDHNVVCYYIIRVHGAIQIRVTFNALNTEVNKDTIEVGSGNNASMETSTHIRMGRFTETRPKDIIYNASSMFMIYVTDHNIPSQGFNATITADFDDCVSFPCKNGGTCKDEFQGFVCICPETTTGMRCETDVILISSTAPFLTNDDVTLPSPNSIQSLSLTFDLRLTTSQHSANPHVTIQSASTSPAWTVAAFFSEDGTVNATRVGVVDIPLEKDQSDFTLENHVTFRNIDVINMKIPETTSCSDIGYFCTVFNPNNDGASSSSSSSSSSLSSSSSSSSLSSTRIPGYVIRGDPDPSAFVGCSRVMCKESDDVIFSGNSTWVHLNIVLIIVIGFISTALVIIVVLVLIKSRNKVKLMFIHTPASPTVTAAPVIRWTPPVPQSSGESSLAIHGSSESSFGIVNEGASCQIESESAPPYSKLPAVKKL